MQFELVSMHPDPETDVLGNSVHSVLFSPAVVMVACVVVTQLKINVVCVRDANQARQNPPGTR
jgi:hypothetical protein